MATAILHNIILYIISLRENDPPENVEMARLLVELRNQRCPQIEDESLHINDIMYRNDNVTGRAVRRALQQLK